MGRRARLFPVRDPAVWRTLQGTKLHAWAMLVVLRSRSTRIQVESIHSCPRPPAASSLTPLMVVAQRPYLPHQVVVLADVHVFRGNDAAGEGAHLGARLDPRFGEDAEALARDRALGDDHLHRQHQAGQLLHLCSGAGAGSAPESVRREALPFPPPCRTSPILPNLVSPSRPDLTRRRLPDDQEVALCTAWSLESPLLKPGTLPALDSQQRSGVWGSFLRRHFLVPPQILKAPPTPSAFHPGKV